jgi:hypothetical protein
MRILAKFDQNSNNDLKIKNKNHEREIILEKIIFAHKIKLKLILIIIKA